MLVLEAGGPFQAKPGSFNEQLAGKPFRRWWWAWFAVAYYPGSLFEFHEIVAADRSEWRVERPAPQNNNPPLDDSYAKSRTSADQNRKRMS